jgi:hypothetical protein
MGTDEIVSQGLSMVSATKGDEVEAKDVVLIPRLFTDSKQNRQKHRTARKCYTHTLGRRGDKMFCMVMVVQPHTFTKFTMCH